MHVSSRALIGAMLLLSGSLSITPAALAQAGQGVSPAHVHGTGLPTLMVHKGPACGCCDKWIAIAKAEGFKVEVIEADDITAIKRTVGVPQAQETCHTATAGGYFFEGHVPLDLVRKVLETRPTIAGLLVAGMPPSSPGMDDGRPHEPFDVLVMGRDGKLTTYARR